MTRYVYMLVLALIGVLPVALAPTIAGQWTPTPMAMLVGHSLDPSLRRSRAGPDHRWVNLAEVVEIWWRDHGEESNIFSRRPVVR